MRAVRQLLALPAILLRTYGLRGVVRRARHEVRARFNAFQRRPSSRTYADSGARAVAYGPANVDSRNVPPARRERALRRAQLVLEGCYEAFGHEWRRFPGEGRAWHAHGASGYEFPMAPWWQVALLPPQADVKDVWEPARFAWVYDLLRADVLAPDARYGRAFHEILARWIAANPPFVGPHWACGQETGIRALALLHAETRFIPPADMKDANGRIARVLGWSAERIADAIGYGLSQRNNHGISESAALVHLGLRLRADHPDAQRWLASGMRLLEEQILDQFAADGWYAQHSFTYMRVALEQALLARRALQAAGSDLSAACLSRLNSSYDLLVLLIDAETGVVPNHGANDGGRVLPYSTAPYRDFRPLLTLVATVLERALPADIPADDEVVRWLGATQPRRDPARPDGVRTGSSGWAVARVRDAFVFLRAGTYSHRPSHLDTLHADVRFGACEVVVDPGTFSYNAPPPWRNALASAVVHNGPVLDASEPARRGPRFLWYSWPSARVVQTQFDTSSARLVAEMPRRVTREIVVESREVSVIDSVLDGRVSSLQVTWLLHPDVQSEDAVQATGAEGIAAHETDVTGWFSPTYGMRLPSKALRVRVARNAGPLACVTRIQANAQSESSS